jgi:hypothetical protein
MPFPFGPVECASAVYKRSRVGEKVFQWDLINIDGSTRKETFRFAELVEVSAHPKDIQELQLDLLLSFVQKMKNSNILVVHISTGNSLANTLIQSGEDANLLVADLERRGRLRDISVHSILHLYAALDLLLHTLDTEVIGTNGQREEPPTHVLLLMDHLEPLLSDSGGGYESAARAAVASASAEAPTARPGSCSTSSCLTLASLSEKLKQLIENQAVLCVNVLSAREKEDDRGDTTASTAGHRKSAAANAGTNPMITSMFALSAAPGKKRSDSGPSADESSRKGVLSRSFHYIPRVDSL